MGLPIALQLYTVRDETEKDFLGTLQKVAAMGYDGVEFAGFGDIPAKKMKAELDRLGLKAAGSHTGIDLLKNKLDKVIEYNLEIGNRYVICPWEKYETKEDYLKAAELYDRIGKNLRENGLQFGYHNHSHEFQEFNGEYGLDLLFKGTAPENMIAELDTCWVFHAGVDPVAYVGKYKGRLPLVHIKDLKSRDGKEFSEIGRGVIDIPSIVKAAKNSGAEWLVIEIDQTPGPSLESARIGVEYLRSL